MNIDTAYLIAVAGIIIMLAFSLLVIIGLYNREKKNSKVLANDIRLKESKKPESLKGKCMDVSVQLLPEGKTAMVVTMFNDNDLVKFEQLIKLIKPGIDIWINSSIFLPSRRAVYLSSETWAVIDGQRKEGWSVLTTEEFIDSLQEIRTASI